MTFKGHKDSKLQFIYSANGNGSKTAKIIKKYPPSVAVNTMAGLAMVNLYTKFEVSRFTSYEAVKSGAKCRNWGGLGRFEGTQGHGQCQYST